MQKIFFCAFLSLAVLACGDSPVQPTPQAPVASVSMTPTTSGLVPTQTVQLTATARDAAGAAQAGRTITWSSSAPSVATVNAGLVTAVTPGTATITASSEGRNATAAITVQEGAWIGPAGGTLVAVNGAVQVEVPAGALTTSLAITATARSQPPPEPEGYWLVGGPTWDMGPDGTVFAEPVTVTLDYDPAVLPPWIGGEDLILQRWNGTEWQPLTDILVDPEAKTVSGKTTGFSAFGLSTELPDVKVDPESGHVNTIQRSVVLTANVVGPPLDNLWQFSYHWTSTGQNGTITSTSGAGAQYTATIPVLPGGGELVDKVYVTVMAVRIDGTGSPEPVGTAQADVFGDLEFTYELTPWSSEIQFEESQDLELVIRDDTGNRVNLVGAGAVSFFYKWSETGNAGHIPPPLEELTNKKMVTYATKPTAEQVPLPPRGDRITVAVIRQTKIPAPTQREPGAFTLQNDEIGRAEAFVTVGGELHAGRFGIVTTPADPGRSCVNAYWYVPLVDGINNYDLRLYNYDDPIFWGTEYTREFSGPEPDGGGKDTAISQVGNEWRGLLSGVCGPNDKSGEYHAYLAGRFAGMIVTAVVTPVG